MRGRTNITGGGMNLNAQEKEFTVASGESVVSGDFVEYFTTSSEKTLISNNFSAYHQTYIGNGMCVNQSSGVLYLLKQNQDGLEIVDAYNDYVVSDYEVLDDGSIAVLFNESPYVLRLKISGESFQFVCEAIGIPDEEIKRPYEIYINKYNGKLYLFIRKNYTEVPLDMLVLDISNPNIISYIAKSSSENVVEWNITQTGRHSIRKPLFVGGNLYVMSTVNISTSSGSICYMSKFLIENNDISHISYVKIGTFNNNYGVPFFDKYILWIGAKEGVAYSSIYVYNTKSDTYEEYRTNDMGFKTASSYFGAYFSEIDGSKIALINWSNSFSQNGILEIKEATGSIELISNIFEIESGNLSGTKTGIICIDNILNNLFYKNGKTYCYSASYDPNAELLTEKVNRDYVKPYTGGLAIGVAKQSGREGQTIEVYVAKPSE